jgi:hypothetical protein
MNQGVVLFAFDNEAFSYRRMAEWSAQRIHRHLKLPVTLITDRDTDSKNFDQVIVIDNPTSGSRYFADADMSVAWHNHSRSQAAALSPYDQTLVLDTDYVVASDCLLTLFSSDQDFLCHDRAWDVTGLTDYSGLNNFGRNRMPMSWATVMYFRRSDTTDMIFHIMTMIRDHWSHYRDLHGLPARNTFRNDHALSIALNIVRGNCPRGPSIPWALASVDPHHHITQTECDTFRVEFVDAAQKPRYLVLQGQDLHVMGKQDLGEIIGHTI